METNTLTNLPAVRLASGIEPQQKWPLSSTNETKIENAPKLIEMSPVRGDEKTVITVVVQALPPQIPAKLAFNSLMVDTKQMQAQGITSLVATVPSLELTHATGNSVPVSICFLDKDMVTETWLVANFTYENKEEKQGLVEDASNKRMCNTFQKDNTDLFNSPAYQNFYSPVNSNYGFGAHVQYPIGYQRDFFNDKYSQREELNGFSTYNNLFTPPATNSFTNMLTSENGMMHQNYVPPPPTTSNNIVLSSTTINETPYIKSISHTPTTSVANYQPYPGLVSRANLEISGDLDSMTKGWNQEEWEHRRRLVQFWGKQQGNKITCSFEPVPQSERACNNSNIVVSCIYWVEQNDFFITSVDCIYLLECLMDIRFSVEEKNRIRRNLEGFRPLTVSKCKPESAEFFKVIMGFPNPKPRNIEKDVKVFPWKTVPYALKKIVTKYTASTHNNNSKSHPRATACRNSMTAPSTPSVDIYQRPSHSYPNTPHNFTDMKTYFDQVKPEPN